MLDFGQGKHMGTFFLERINKLFKPDRFASGPFEVVGLEEPQAIGFTSDETFEKFVDFADSIAGKFGCTTEMRFKELPGFTHYTNPLYPPPMMMRQVIIVPGASQSVDSFKESLFNISEAMVDSMSIKMVVGQSEDFAKLK